MSESVDERRSTSHPTCFAMFKISVLSNNNPHAPFNELRVNDGKHCALTQNCLFHLGVAVEILNSMCRKRLKKGSNLIHLPTEVKSLNNDMWSFPRWNWKRKSGLAEPLGNKKIKQPLTFNLMVFNFYTGMFFISNTLELLHVHLQ